MNYILTERLRLTVPDFGNLEGHKFVIELMLKDRQPLPHASRSSALADYGPIKHRHMPHAIRLRQSGELAGVIKMTMNLDAFRMDKVDGKVRIMRNGPLECGIQPEVQHEHRGNGYGLEAARAFSNYVMKALGAVRVVSEAGRAEPEVVKLMERLGMRLLAKPRPEYPDRIVGILEARINPSACD